MNLSPMNRIADFFARRRWLLFVALIVVMFVPLLAVSDENTSSRVGLAVFIAALLGFLFLLGLNLSGRDPEAELLAHSVVPDPVGAALITRWLQRSKHFRFVGGLVGAVLGVSFIGESLLPVVFTTLAGIAIGGAAAELHAIGRRRSAVRNADIAVRRLADYVAPTDAIALVAVGCGAVAAAGAVILTDTTGDVALVAALGALVTVVATALMQWFVVVRSRPALSVDLRSADDLMRHLAATQGFTRPAIALGIALLAKSVSSLGTEQAYQSIAILLGVAAVIWYVRSRQNATTLMAAVAS